jgi:L-iditol 2-dehydrogenase
MHAAVLTAPDRIELHEVEEPAFSATRIRVRSVGLCGTDLKIVAGRIPVELPRIIGHEIGAEVLEDGGLAPGTPVLVDPGVTCGACPQCRAGRGNICTRGWLLGRDRDGGLREVMDVPSAHLHPLPSSVPVELAPLLQVLATCVHGQRLLPVAADASVVVLGLGVTGLLHLQLARDAGAARIVGVSRSPGKLELASTLGADAVVRAGGEDEVRRVLEVAGGGVDLVIECVGSVATLARAVELVSIGGAILAYGTIPETEGRLPFYDLYYKELVVAHPRSAKAEDFPASIDAVASGRVRVAELVSDRFPLARATDALAAAAAPGARKIMIDL